jgi:hypothetical protein
MHKHNIKNGIENNFWLIIFIYINSYQKGFNRMLFSPQK